MKKIMFNDRYGLTQAVIEGRKTMTRPIVPTKTRLRRALAVIHDEPHRSEQEEYLKSACYKVGEIVAVAQRYQDIFDYSNCVNPYDWEDDDKPSGWTNKMLTKAKLMPHRIRITGIKCERLQDISNTDCLKEGIRQAYAESIHGMYGYIDHKGTGLWFNTPREAFAALIDKVYGKRTWASNPWVVAYEFELVK